MIDPLKTVKFESEILDLIENRDEYTQSDLQGVVAVLVDKIMREGHKILSESEQE